MVLLREERKRAMGDREGDTGGRTLIGGGAKGMEWNGIRSIHMGRDIMPYYVVSLNILYCTQRMGRQCP